MSGDEESEIKRELRTLNDKFDRFLIGRDGTDGVLPRMSRIESRQSTHATIIGWVIGSIVAMCTAVTATIVHFLLPNWFTSK